MTFIGNIDPQWLEEQYKRWRNDPDKVDKEWQLFFSGFELGQSAETLQSSLPIDDKRSAVDALIYRYRDIGHLMACTDPLSPCLLSHPLLDLSQFNLDEGDLDKRFATEQFEGKDQSLREMISTLRETYCGSVGVEFMHISEPVECQWLIDRMEPVRNKTELTSAERVHLFHHLAEAGLFEAFLHRRFPGQKRFSLEGGEALIVMLDQVIQHASHLGVTSAVLGMAHRGRLAVLATIMGKPLANIFAEFADNLELGFVGEGDVKYHKGFSSDRTFPEGHRVHLTLAFNPSHLEAVNPVVEGKTRAQQDRTGINGKKSVLPILMHGDAAFAGQGIVAETLNLSQLEGYTTGGTIHLVLNNQIGFTTLPKDARSTRYSTDIARMLMVPIFHVHGEDPEAVAHVARLASEYRHRFGRDVVVEIICYRRHGHNEGDEPYFTQPLMYAQIKDRPPVHRIYYERLVSDGIPTDALLSVENEITEWLEQAFAMQSDPSADLGFAGNWSTMERTYAPLNPDTGVDGETLTRLAESLAEIPFGFALHKKVEILLHHRLDSVRNGRGIDWGCAEALAFSSLLHEGTSIRLSGQDSRRGTFNHRHAVLHDMATDALFTPLETCAKNNSCFRIYDSLLSEYAVLGFEYGYAAASPGDLVIWEAQFGDFANGAQVIIDQFIAGGEAKWNRSCGIVLLLPHGYEGNGAEHSSARIERWLSLCAEENMLITYPSTPAQFFHLLRRQVKLPFRKPLVAFTPKGLLRHPDCVSDLRELISGSFQEVIVEEPDKHRIRSVLFCSGKIYHELATHRKTIGKDDVAIIRIEQFYPLRVDLLKAAASRFTEASDFCWVQEEPLNMGACAFICSRLTEATGRHIRVVARPDAAAPAVGSHRVHGFEQDKILRQAFQEE